MSDSDDFEVIVVGGGPVGVALALDLGSRGVDVALVERREEPQRIPKGQNLTNRTLELMYFWGIEQEIRGARLLPEELMIGGVTAYGNLMSDYWYAAEGAPGRGAEVAQYFFQRNDRLPQYITEAVMRRRLKELPNVVCRFGWTATRVLQSDATASVHIADRSGAERLLEAEYVVGCDGAQSFTRNQVGITSTRDDLDRVMVLAVFKSTMLQELLERFPARTTYRVIRPDLHGFWQFFGRVDEHGEWFFHAPSHGVASDDLEVKRLMEEAVGTAFSCELEHVGHWDLRIAIADEYARGRVLIAGDAAHSHPPYGGFGVNSGFEDAANLGWKLAAVLQGWGGGRLLDSYGEERQPVFRGIRDTILGGIQTDREFLARCRPEPDRLAFERAWNDYSTYVRPDSQPYVPHYEGSPIVFGPDGAVSGVDGTHRFAARVGNHLAPCQLSSGRSTYEELGSMFTLLAFDAVNEDVGNFEHAARSIGVPLRIVRDDLAGPGRAYESRMVLVRPDQHVAWVGDTPLPGAVTVLRRAVGHDVLAQPSQRELDA